MQFQLKYMCSWLGLLSWSGAAIDVTLAPTKIYFRCKSKMYSLLLLLHHFGEDGILELLHLQPPTSTVQFQLKYMCPTTTNKFGFKYILVGARVTSIAAVRIGAGSTVLSCS